MPSTFSPNTATLELLPQHLPVSPISSLAIIFPKSGHQLVPTKPSTPQPTLAQEGDPSRGPSCNLSITHNPPPSTPSPAGETTPLLLVEKASFNCSFPIRDTRGVFDDIIIFFKHQFIKMQSSSSTGCEKGKHKRAMAGDSPAPAKLLVDPRSTCYKLNLLRIGFFLSSSPSASHLYLMTKTKSTNTGGLSSIASLWHGTRKPMPGRGRQTNVTRLGHGASRMCRFQQQRVGKKTPSPAASSCS